MNKAKRFCLAKALDNKMREAEKEINHAEAVLQHQLSQLCTALSADKMEGSVRGIKEEIKGDVQRQVQGVQDLELSHEQTQSDVRKIADGIDSLEKLKGQVPGKEQVPAVAETYRVGSNLPVLPDNMQIDFDARDEEGKYCVPEGELRSTLLSSTT